MFIVKISMEKRDKRNRKSKNQPQIHDDSDNESPQPPRYRALVPNDVSPETSKRETQMYSKIWGQHAPITFGQAEVRVYETRTIATQTPSLLPGVVNVLGGKDGSPTSLGELLRFAAPTISFPKLQTLSKSPNKNILDARHKHASEYYRRKKKFSSIK